VTSSWFFLSTLYLTSYFTETKICLYCKDQVTHKRHHQTVAQCCFFYVVLLYRNFPKHSLLVAVTIRQ